IVGVVVFHLYGIGAVASQNMLAETWGEPLDLVLNACSHIVLGTAGDVAVRPDGMLASRGARGVEEALLGQQHKGPLGMLSLPDCPFSLGNLGLRSAYMDRSSKFT